VLYLRGTKRSTLVGAALVVVIDVTLLTIALTTYFGGATPTRIATTTSTSSRGAPYPATTLAHPRVGGAATNSLSSRPSSDRYRPLRVVPPPTAVQQAIDASLAQSSNEGSVSLLERTAFPTPATSAAFPEIDAADSSSASLYALAFTQELLDVHFATSTREDLLAWADFNAAPYSLGSVPEPLSSRVLALSLTTGSSPLPSASKWSHFAQSRVSWNVSGLVVSVSPLWTQALSAGWMARDPMMVIYDVSGTLTVTSRAHVPVVESVSFALTLGGAALHPGYGAVALDDWTVN